MRFDEILDLIDEVYVGFRMKKTQNTPRTAHGTVHKINNKMSQSPFHVELSAPLLQLIQQQACVLHLTVQQTTHACRAQKGKEKEEVAQQHNNRVPSTKRANGRGGGGRGGGSGKGGVGSKSRLGCVLEKLSTKTNAHIHKKGYQQPAPSKITPRKRLHYNKTHRKPKRRQNHQRNNHRKIMFPQNSA